MSDNQHSYFYVEVHVNAPMFNFLFDDSFLYMCIKNSAILVHEVCLLCVFCLLSFE